MFFNVSVSRCYDIQVLYASVYQFKLVFNVKGVFGFKYFLIDLHLKVKYCGPFVERISTHY